MAGADGTRNRERTRRAILDAGTRLFRERGAGVSLDAIATAAGVSKSGLLHHFSNRDELVRAVARDAIDRLRARVLTQVDLSENYPGKLLRAYIRTLFSSEEAQSHFDYPGLWDTLALVDGVTEMLMEDARQWRESFALDGLHEDRILLAYNAAEGLIANAQWDTNITPAMLDSARDTLLALTEDNGPINGHH